MGGLDRYSLKKKELLEDVDMYPTIIYPDTVRYLIFTLSAHTLEEMKNCKSLTAYNRFVSSWIKEIGTKSFENFGKVLLIGMASRRGVCKKYGII